MTFDDVIRNRYSVRKFRDQSIERDKLRRILDAGRIAPTAKNYQPQRIYILESDSSRSIARELSICTYNAPTILLIGYDVEEAWKNPLEEDISSGEVDAAIVATHIMLKTLDEGLGSCWVGRFSPTEARQKLNLPENFIPVLMLPIGYADMAASERHSQRKNIEDFTYFI